MNKQDKIYYKIGLYNQKNKRLYNLMQNSGSNAIKDFNRFNQLIRINTLLTNVLNNRDKKFSKSSMINIIIKSIQQSKKQKGE